MLVIRDAQMAAFEAEGLKRYKAHLVESVKKHWPERSAALGDEGVRGEVDRAIERADGYGIVSQKDVFRYLNVSFMLGAGFDTDPTYPWAEAILKDDAMAPSEKMDRIVDRIRALRG
ncbi:hypothetical protein WME77_12760 [Sorangium sp. So ce764]|uniref:hypothetical protein n=1 Tax=Sorangium sp. So ce764 TaxID=3133320 RepID=UPI003F5FC72A